MTSQPNQQMATFIIDPLFMQELEVPQKDVSGGRSTKTYMLQEHWKHHDGHFFWIVRFLDEYHCQKSISIEALWARIYMTLSDTETLFLIDRCRMNLLPKGCDVESLNAVSAIVAQSAGQPEKILEMFDNWGAPIAPREWAILDNNRRLERLSGPQHARVDEFTLGASHNLVENQSVHNENVTLSQHLAGLANNPQAAPSRAQSQPAQNDHLSAAQQGTNFSFDLLDTQLKKTDLEFIMSRNEAPVRKSSWKKTSMQLPAPSPNFPVSDVSALVKGRTSTTTCTHTNLLSDSPRRQGQAAHGTPFPSTDRRFPC